ncbi:PROTEIN putative (DUF247)-RELATED-RELATED [Salix viminalis]|uniref:PROTEIN putative (DUF247)-RELATED-RELATED n=1 Tax=Salix viminalis TaxID=40686 RepID=A0A9Q0P9R7_SALVM|nr:PROTEIN putative (DUF247)-RELATED-RELATED [Salix viminalis]
MTSNANPSFDEHRWMINIRRTLDEELEDDTEIPVCIFNVLKILMTSCPDCFVPQQVAIGPYHYWRPELYEMERYKLAAAKRAQKRLESLKFSHIVGNLINLELKIRACYHKFLDFSNETLAWMMAIDASFLLEFLQIYAVKEGIVLTGVSSRMSHLVDYAGRKSAHNAILRDMVMLENQIPLFVLRKILEIQLSSLEMADETLLSMLAGFYKEISPFKMLEEIPSISISHCAHLLDYLYDITVPKIEAPEEMNEADGQLDEAMEGEFMSSENSNLAAGLGEGLVRLLKRLLVSRHVKVMLKLPWTIVSNLPVCSFLKQPVEYFFFSQDKEVKPENENLNNELDKPPLAEEIAIPCAAELFRSGIRFSPTTGNILSISFDVKTDTFYLPIISLDVNTEVVLRNMVAYEASNASGPLVFTRYTELMNGIIDTEEDVKLLREKGVILNRLKSDEEVAMLWNGMSKSIRLTKVPFLDKVIEDVNRYYNGRWIVKGGKFMKQYVFSSWQFLTLLAAIFLLLLMALQVFCTVYRYTRILHVRPSGKQS